MTPSELGLLAQAAIANSAGLGGRFSFILVLGVAAIAGLFLLVAAIAFMRPTRA